MEPALRAGDRLVVDYRGTPDAGDVVVADFPDGALVVKRAAYRQSTGAGEPGWFLLGDNRDQGVDSRHRGALPERSIRGVVRFRIWPRPGRVRSRV